MCVPGGDASERRGDGGSACNVNIVKEVDGHRVRGNVCLDLVRAMPCGFPLYVTVRARGAREVRHMFFPMRYGFSVWSS